MDNSDLESKSASSYITLSFWVKSSVAQTFYGFLRTLDGTGQDNSFNYALSDNSGPKVTKTITMNSNIDINDDNGNGMSMFFLFSWELIEQIQVMLRKHGQI